MSKYEPIPYKGFLGGSNQNPNMIVDIEDCWNLYPEVVSIMGIYPKNSEVTPINLRRRPGYKKLLTLPVTPCRGIYEDSGRCFVVAASTLYELTLTGTTYSYTAWGTLTNDTPGINTPVSFASNDTQILLISQGYGYVFTYATNVLVPITSGAFPAGQCVQTRDGVCIDTYGIVLQQNTNEFFYSNPLDFTQWSGLQFSSNEAPDNAVTIAELNNYLWVFGQKEITIYQDTGGTDNVFTRYPGVQIEMGCEAPQGVAQADNSLFFIARHQDGYAMAMRTKGVGGAPARISTHAIEANWQTYSTCADCYITSMQFEGHVFVSYHFPTAGAVWTYDCSSNLWHRRGYWTSNFQGGSFTEDLGRYHALWNETHIIADFSSGNIYTASYANATDNGNNIRCIRIGPYLSDGLKYTVYRSAIIDINVGDTTIPQVSGSPEPVLLLSWTNDNGRNWSTPRALPLGFQGQYLTRVRTNSLNRARTRAFQVVITDPIPDLAITGFVLLLEKGTQ